MKAVKVILILALGLVLGAWLTLKNIEIVSTNEIIAFGQAWRYE